MSLTVQALCTRCTQRDVAVTMRGIKSGVFNSTHVNKAMSSELVCEVCGKPAPFIVKTR